MKKGIDQLDYKCKYYSIVLNSRGGDVIGLVSLKYKELQLSCIFDEKCSVLMVNGMRELEIFLLLS
jgi:hypothetical protein